MRVTDDQVSSLYSYNPTPEPFTIPSGIGAGTGSVGAPIGGGYGIPSAPVYNQPAPAYGVKPPGAYSDGMGHWWNEATQSWWNDSGGEYQPAAPAYVEPAQQWQDPFFGNFDAGAAQNLGVTQPPAPTNRASFIDYPQQGQAKPVTYDLNTPQITQFSDTFMDQFRQETPAWADVLRQPDPVMPGYKEDVRFPEGSMIGDPLDYLLNTFGRPAAETAFQALSPWKAGIDALPGGSGSAGDIFAGWQDLGDTFGQSGLNPNKFMDIQRDKYAERPWYQQLAGDAVFDPLNLVGAGTAKKLGLIDDAADLFKGADKGLELAELATGTKKGSRVIPGAVSEMPQFAPDLERGLADDFSMGISGGKAYPQLQGAQAFAKGAIPGGAERRVIPDSMNASAKAVPVYDYAEAWPGNTRIIDEATKMGGQAYVVEDAMGKRFGTIFVSDGKVMYSTIPEGAPIRGAANIEEARKAIMHTATQYSETVGPAALANERLWFHSTRDMAYDLPDPDSAVARITQGPGIYMAADPAKSAGVYGPRTFVAEFDGRTLDLTAPTSLDAPLFTGGPTWRQVYENAAVKLDNLGMNDAAARVRAITPQDVARAKAHAEVASPTSGYNHKQALIDAINKTTDEKDMFWGWSGPGAKSADEILGRFAGVTGHTDNPKTVIGAFVQNHLADEGVDALFHHSPGADGDVLIVLNGEKARAVADVKNAPDAVKGGATVRDIKRGTLKDVLSGARDQGGPNSSIRPDQRSVTFAGKYAGTVDKGVNGDWVASSAMGDVRSGFANAAEAKAWLRQRGGIPPVSIRSFGGGESGLAGAEFAARLAGQTALGAGVGAAYGEASGGDWKTGALVGASVGAGLGAGFKVADTLGSKGVAGKLHADLYPRPEAATKLVDLLKEAKPIRGAQEELYSAERARRAAIGSQALKGGSPQTAFKRARGAMGGALPTDPSFAAVQHQLDPQEVTDLLEHIRSTPLRGSQNDFYTKINAETALVKALTGVLPTNSEIELLGKVFGDDFAQVLRSKRSLGAKAWENFVDAANLPRALMTAWDVSAPLRQGAILSLGHPKAALRSTGAMIRAMASPKYAQLVAENIENSPNAALYDKMGLYFADMSRLGELTKREEAIMSRVAGKIPGVGGSQRGYATYLNKLRQDIADGFISRNPNLSDEEWKQFGHFINIASGRGDLPENIAKQSGLMNAFFAPRYAMSRLQLPIEAAKMLADPRIGRHARAEMARDLVAFATTGTALLGLGKMAGVWDVEVNPLSTDFGKGRIGPQRFDFWAGEQQIARYAAQLATGKRKTSTGEIIDRGRRDVVKSWLNTKLSPAAGLVTDLYRGENFIGDPVDFSTKEGIAKQSWERLAPLFLQDMAEAAKVTGNPWRALSAAPSAVGVSTMAYEDSDYKQRDDASVKAFGVPYEQLDKRQRLAVDDSFGKIDPHSPEAKASAEMTARLTTQQQASDQSLATGNMTPEQWRKDYSDRKAERWARNDQIWSKTKFEDTDDPILAGYYKAIDRAEGKDGKVDWDRVDEYRKSLSAKDQRWIEGHTGYLKIDTPQTRAFEKINDEIEASGFFDKTDANWERVSQGLGITGYDSYYDWRDGERQKILKASGYTLSDVGAVAYVDKYLDQQPAALYMKQFGREWSDAWIQENPQAAYHAWQFGYFEPREEYKAALAQMFEGPK